MSVMTFVPGLCWISLHFFRPLQDTEEEEIEDDLHSQRLRWGLLVWCFRSSIVIHCLHLWNRHVFCSHQLVFLTLPILALDRWRWLATNLGGSSKRPPMCQRSARDCWIPSAMDLQDPASMVALFLVLSKDEDSRKMSGRRLSLEPTVSGVFISAYLSLFDIFGYQRNHLRHPFFSQALWEGVNFLYSNFNDLSSIWSSIFQIFPINNAV